METKKNIAYVLKKELNRRNRSFAEFSEEIGIARSSLQSYLKADSNPRLDTLILLAEKPNIPVSQLLGDDSVRLPVEEKEPLSSVLKKIGELHYELSQNFFELAEMVSELEKP